MYVQPNLLRPWRALFGQAICNMLFYTVIGLKQSHRIISFSPNVFLVITLGNAVPDNEENEKLCLCPGCPTYKKSNFSSNVFCAKGKAKEKVNAVSCLCPNCPVFKKYALDQMYYCIKGKSLDIQS